MATLRDNLARFASKSTGAMLTVCLRSVVISIASALLWAACSGANDGSTASCAPGHGTTVWGTEGSPLTVTVTCSSGEELVGDAFVFDTLPAGAEYDAESSSLRWTPGLDQAAVYTIVARVADRESDIGEIRIGVADKPEDPDNVPIVDPLAYSEEYGLPVVFLQNAPNDEVYVPSEIIYRGRSYQAEAKLRGASSLSYPKKNYTLRFDNNDRFSDEDKLNTILKRKKMVLTSTFDDNSYVRQRLAFHLWNTLDTDHLQVQAFHVVVYLEGEYWGLYAMTDHVDRFLVQQHGLPIEGNLYKAVNHSANFDSVDDDGNDKDNLHQGFRKKEGCESEADSSGPCEGDRFADLVELITFATTASDGEFAADLVSRIDTRDYENWWVLVMLTVAGDSAAKNSYHYHDPNGGRWRTVPWDFNHSFGQNWRTQRIAANNTSDFLHRNHLFMRIDAIGAQLQKRLLDTMNGPATLETILEALDTMQAEIQLSAQKDWNKWKNAYREFQRWSTREDFTDREQEAAYVRTWITDRWAELQDRYAE